MTKELSKRILHVEDDPDLQRYVAVLLSDVANVTAVRTLKEARAAIAKTEYDLFVIDFTLPDGSGSELVIELAKQHPAIPVVVFSAHEITGTVINVSHVFVKGESVRISVCEAL
jgi:DNA-binding NtrC family response regulator